MHDIKNLYHEVSNKFFVHVHFLMIKCNISSFSNYELGNVSNLSNLSSSVFSSNVISLHSWKYKKYPPNGLIPYFQNLLKEQNWKNQIIWCFCNFGHSYYLVSINHTHVNNESKYKHVQVYYSFYSLPPSPHTFNMQVVCS